MGNPLAVAAAAGAVGSMKHVDGHYAKQQMWFILESPAVLLGALTREAGRCGLLKAAQAAATMQGPSASPMTLQAEHAAPVSQDTSSMMTTWAIWSLLTLRWWKGGTHASLEPISEG
uniref:Uncharacterized protein n=1 Tax=Tetradesmus obliquus TaxID=3088 RepID=A0A383VNR5_TETOB|eukprot:jgi/Sobl393_1/15052/SZX66801.1